MTLIMFMYIVRFVFIISIIPCNSVMEDQPTNEERDDKLCCDACGQSQARKTFVLTIFIQKRTSTVLSIWNILWIGSLMFEGSLFATKTMVGMNVTTSRQFCYSSREDKKAQNDEKRNWAVFKKVLDFNCKEIIITNVPMVQPDNFLIRVNVFYTNK